MKMFRGMPVVYQGDPKKLARLTELADRVVRGAKSATPRLSEQAVDALLTILEPEVKRIDKLLEQVERDGWTY